jgi:hypothetical protein
VRLIAYAWQDTAQAAGWDTSFIMHGTDTANTSSDHRGPLIGVRPVNADGTQGSASYSDMFTSALPLRCDIVIYDESGVDVVGTGPDEGVTVEIPGVLSKRNMNATFSPREGDFREWVSPFTLSEGQVQPGRYQLIITARDLLENLTKTNIELEVVTSEALRLNHVYNFPNPMRMGGTTRFFYSMPGTEVALQNSLVLRIYTLSGKLIRAVRQPENGWEWDGRDEFGNVLGPNTYLYQMVAWSVQGKTGSTSSPIRKLVIHPPR